MRIGFSERRQDSSCPSRHSVVMFASLSDWGSTTSGSLTTSRFRASLGSACARHGRCWPGWPRGTRRRFVAATSLASLTNQSSCRTMRQVSSSIGTWMPGPLSSRSSSPTSWHRSSMPLLTKDAWRDGPRSKCRLRGVPSLQRLTVYVPKPDRSQRPVWAKIEHCSGPVSGARGLGLLFRVSAEPGR